MRLKGRRRMAVRDEAIRRWPRRIHGGWREREGGENRNQGRSKRSYMSDGVADKVFSDCDSCAIGKCVARTGAMSSTWRAGDRGAVSNAGATPPHRIPCKPQFTDSSTTPADSNLDAYKCLVVSPSSCSLVTMSAIGSLVFCTDCGTLLDSGGEDQSAILVCDVCGARCKGLCRRRPGSFHPTQTADGTVLQVPQTRLTQFTSAFHFSTLQLTGFAGRYFSQVHNLPK